MPNRDTPLGQKHSGFHRDDLNNRLELYHKGTFVGYFASGAGLNRMAARLGSMASLASNGGNAISGTTNFIAPASLKIISAWRMNQTKSDVPKGTATTSASYRRITLITNTAGAGTGTNIIASLNATASAASNVTRAFTTIASTVPAGAIIKASHLTVGAATADGTDMAESDIFFTYELV